jgi:hypothetical protein
VRLHRIQTLCFRTRTRHHGIHLCFLTLRFLIQTPRIEGHSSHTLLPQRQNEDPEHLHKLQTRSPRASHVNQESNDAIHNSNTHGFGEITHDARHNAIFIHQRSTGIIAVIKVQVSKGPLIS